MTTETQTQEVAKTATTEVTPPAKSEKITVDLEGVAVELDVETAKKLIAKRQESKKENSDLKQKVAAAEANAKAEADKASLLKAMRDSDIESVKQQVASEYLDKIAKYENKIYRETTKTALVAAGILPEAADDATSLALQSAKLALEGDTIKINEKPLSEFIQEFVKTRQHLVAVKQTQANKVGVKPAIPQKPSMDGKASLTKGLDSFLKNTK